MVRFNQRFSFCLRRFIEVKRKQIQEMGFLNLSFALGHLTNFTTRNSLPLQIDLVEANEHHMMRPVRIHQGELTALVTSTGVHRSTFPCVHMKTEAEIPHAARTLSSQALKSNLARRGAIRDAQSVISTCLTLLCLGPCRHLEPIVPLCFVSACSL